MLAVFAALRVFAIWNRSYVWSMIVLALGLVPFGTNMVSRSYTPQNFPASDRPRDIYHNVAVWLHRRTAFRRRVYVGDVVLCTDHKHVCAVVYSPCLQTLTSDDTDVRLSA